MESGGGGVQEAESMREDEQGEQSIRLSPPLRYSILRQDKSTRSVARKASSSSPENHYTTRGSVLNGAGEESKKKVICHSNGGESNKGVGVGVGMGGHVWPKLYLGLSNKEKEEDFIATKGCKPAHRPKKRSKSIQRNVLLVCPGGWLADMCHDRYQVREMKSSKKRTRGLKSMGILESDSE